MLLALATIAHQVSTAVAQNTIFTTLHNFAGFSESDNCTNSDGAGPCAGLILSGNTLYGTALNYGPAINGNGTIFAVKTNGTGFTVLHGFTGGSDGGGPYGGLMISSNTLYGTASGGGSSGCGTVFKVNTNGTGFSTLYSFTGGDDGGNPEAGLILSGNSLYGTAEYGGDSGRGTVFKVNTDGTGFSTLYSFTGGDDGGNPLADLILSGNTLYGTASGIYSSSDGTVFKVNTDGTGFSTLYSFTGGADGANPEAGLVLSGNTLYGTASGGGTSGCGTVFKVNTDGSGFTVLHGFTALDSNTYTNGDGAYPAGLFLSGNTLYGTAVCGGSSGNGTAFKINTDGTGFAVLHSFTATAASSSASTNSDGVCPQGMILSGNTLYGTAYDGGVAGNGTVFKFNTTGTGFTVLHGFTAVVDIILTNDDGSSPNGGLSLAGGILYGTTADGGGANNGSVFRVNTNGTGFTMLHDFSGLNDAENSDGAVPFDGLTLSGNTLYGTAFWGGSGGNGTVFKVNTTGTGFTVLHNFTGYLIVNGLNGDGANPGGKLLLSGNTLYGSASQGGGSGNGTVFKVNTDGTGFSTLYSFTGGADGANPEAGLILSGNSLYGTASDIYSSRYGTVFKVNTDGTGFSTLYSFSGGADGANPEASLVLSGNTLYGTAEYGGSSGCGTVFKVNTNGTGFSTLYSFTGGADGGNPEAGLILSGNSLYGTAGCGGSANNGTVFKVHTDGTGFAVLHSFTATAGSSFTATNNDGACPQGMILSGSTLYGTARGGGSSSGGTVFSLSLPLELAIVSSGTNVILTWPTNFTGYALQSATNLAPPVAWSAVSPAPVFINGLNTVTNSASRSSQRFFRLIRQ